MLTRGPWRPGVAITDHGGMTDQLRSRPQQAVGAPGAEAEAGGSSAASARAGGADGSGGARTTRRGRPGPEVVALVAATLLLALAFLAEPLGWWGGNVHQWLPPLSAHFDPTVGWGLLLAAPVALAVVVRGPGLAASMRFGRLAWATGAVGALWGVGNAAVRGWQGGFVAPLSKDDEYLSDVPRVTSVLGALRVYTDRILLDAPGHWETHSSGHPPLPLFFYVGLERIGLGGAAASGIVTALIASTGVVAVLFALRTLGDERRARLAAPFLALAPMVVWTWISADGGFMAVAAWGLALLALAATAPWGRRALVLSLAAGLVLGVCLFLSYGLILLAPLAVAVLVAARTWRPLLPAILAALVPVVLFAAAGFWWVEAEQILVERYYQGKGRLRQHSYWLWGNLAVTAFVLGPAAVAGIGVAISRTGAGVRERRWRAPATAGTADATTAGPAGTTTTARPTLAARVPALLDRLAIPPAGWMALAGATAILVATATGLSKSETERIWLPFMLWLVPLTAWLPVRHQRAWLVAAAAWTVAVSVVFRTTW